MLDNMQGSFKVSVDQNNVMASFNDNDKFNLNGLHNT